MPDNKQAAASATFIPVKRGHSPKEAAAITGLSLATINRGIYDGSIPSTKFKNRRIISDETINKLLAPAT